MPPRALAYSRFTQLLVMLECYIPAFPQNIGAEFLIYRWGQGYNPKPGGPAVAFIHREKDDMVTALEIEKALRILDIPASVFWHHANNCMVEPDAKAATEAAPQTKPSC